jgi:hypothetical protein
MAEEVSRISVAEAICALVTIVLTILALAHAAPNFLVAIATIVFGAALLLLHGSATLPEYGRMYVKAGASFSPTMPASDGGLSAVLVAGAASVVLGVLGLLGVSTTELTAIAVIAFGGALVLGSSSPAPRMHLFKLALAKTNERVQRLASDPWAGDMLSSSAGIFGLAVSPWHSDLGWLWSSGTCPDRAARSRLGEQAR